MRAVLLVVPLIALACGPSGGIASPAATPPSAAPIVVAASAATAAPTSLVRTDLVATYKCDPPATPTAESTEGPYFKAGSPERSSLLAANMPGTRITLIGFVVTRSCRPVSGAKVDVWQADASGTYDNSGYTLRGYTRTNAEGQYRMETIVPGEYPGRTPHIHVKVEAGGKTLTTQLYMPNLSSNARDAIFRPDLVLSVTQGSPTVGGFVFVLDLP